MTTIYVGRHDVEVPRADKPLFPDGITKSDLAGYYRDVADTMLPFLAGRPIAMERYPDGIDGQRLFQKNVPDYFPDWVTRVQVLKRMGSCGRRSATGRRPWSTWPARRASRRMCS